MCIDLSAMNPQRASLAGPRRERSGGLRDLADSVAEALAIVTAERLRRTRQIGLADFVNRLRAG
jgi:hypothetical protein